LASRRRHCSHHPPSPRKADISGHPSICLAKDSGITRLRALSGGPPTPPPDRSGIQGNYVTDLGRHKPHPPRNDQRRDETNTNRSLPRSRGFARRFPRSERDLAPDLGLWGGVVAVFGLACVAVLGRGRPVGACRSGCQWAVAEAVRGAAAVTRCATLGHMGREWVSLRVRPETLGLCAAARGGERRDGVRCAASPARPGRGSSPGAGHHCGAHVLASSRAGHGGRDCPIARLRELQAEARQRASLLQLRRETGRPRLTWAVTAVLTQVTETRACPNLSGWRQHPIDTANPPPGRLPHGHIEEPRRND
jgi:hypothetical protein